jgi:hypothetical protein
MAETKTTKPKKSKLFPDEPTVVINIPVTRFEKDDVWVAVNGKSMQIKRGIDVEVPKCIAEALEHSQNMLIEAMEYEAKAMGKASADELN